ncbi:Radial spoke head 1 [Phlyctochytrium planicorne]|nr:Radial spoke head 1 [Phlyctochytrium planicorne]
MSDNEDEDFKAEEQNILGVYEGDRSELGQRHGKGKNTFPNGDVYEGQYAFGERSGLGVYKWKIGAKYVGEYKNSLRDGVGTLFYPDGSKYKGPFQQGKRHGANGSYYYANGDVYTGDWRNDAKNGRGTYLYKCGSKKVGLWVDGALAGPGEIVHADHKISGHWTGNTLMKLPSKIVFANGHVQTIQEQSFFVAASKGIEA